MVSDKLFNQFIKERDEAILSLNLDTFKAFYEKWAKKGIYDPYFMPPDEVLEISLYKMVLAIRSAPESKREVARKWLLTRGYDLKI